MGIQCLIMKANEMHPFSYLFHEVLYMLRTCPLSIIWSVSTLLVLLVSASRHQQH